MFRKALSVVLALLLMSYFPCHAQSLVPLSSFGGGDGWLAPGEDGAAWLGTGNTERGLAYNPTTGNVILPTRTGNVVKVLDGASGAALSDLAPPDGGFTGGTFLINMVDVADDGAIYVGNLTVSATSNFKVYRWQDESATATVAYDGLTGIPRVGDSFAATGSGTDTVLAAAGTNNVDASNFAAFTTADGSTFSSTAYTAVAGTNTGSNDYRLSLTFVDSDTLIGNQGGIARWTDFGGGSATLVDSIPLDTAQRPLDFAVVGGVPVLAVIDSNSSLVQVFDVSTPNTPLSLASGTNTTGDLTGNGNGTGGVAWGSITGNSATLYAMSTNQGIQAFTFTVPEPTSALPLALGLFALLARRRRTR